MATAQRVIRKLHRPPTAALDEHPASTQAALVVWAALITLLVVALGGFDDPRLLYNGWFRLATVAVTWGLLAWAAATPGPWMAQRLRFGVAGSLGVHTLLALLLLFAHLTFLLTEPEQALERLAVTEPEETPRLVEVSQPVAEQTPVFEKPVPTDRLVAQPEREQVERPAAASAEPTEPTDEPVELASRPIPQAVAARRPRTALTHRARAPGERSRQQESAAVATTEPWEVAEPQEAPTPPTEQRAPDPTTLARAETVQEIAEPDDPTPPEPTPTPPRPTQSRETRPMVAEVPEATRSRRPPVPSETIAEAVAAVDNPNPQQTAARAEPQPEPLDRPTAPQRATASLPEPQLERPVPRHAIARRDTRMPEEPLAASPTPLDRQQRVQVAQAVELTPRTDEAAELSRSRSETVAEREPVGPSARAERTPATESLAVTEVERPSPDEATPQAISTRRRQATDQSARPVEAPERQRQIAATSDVATPLAPEALAAAVPAAATLAPSTSPAPRVLADSRGGTGTAGEGLNLTNDAPAPPTSAAPFAAAAAERSRSTQTERGPALVPTPVAQLARARASAPTPSSTLLTQAIPNAQAAGAERPQEVSASSSAAVDRQFANVPLGDLTAAKGAAQVDTGPPQVAPERGSGRGALGGRLAMQAPTTSSGLGPRRPAAAAMSPTATAVTPAPSVAAGGAPSASQAAVAQTEPTAGGAAADSATGRMARADVARLQQARAPAGATSGGGMTLPSEGPSATALHSGPVAPVSRSSRARAAELGGATGPTVASATAASSSSPRRGGAASPAAAASAIDPVALALLTPLAVDLSRSSARGAGPAVAAERDARPQRETLVPAELGAGGIAALPSLDPGVPQRVARRQTSTLRMTPGRYANPDEGGQTAPRGRARNPAPAFAARTEREPSTPVTALPDLRPKTEAAIELGLAFLAPLQQEDGRWSFSELGDLQVDSRELPSIQADAAATGLALLAFLGGGYDHFDDKYQAVVQRGLDYLVAQQTERGDIFPERNQAGSQVRFYGHGIAALALCEAYGMTGDPQLREPAQAALDYIMDMQHPTKHGWRYSEGTNADLSVSGWQLMALRSGELAGLEVDRRTYRRVGELLNRCRMSRDGRTVFCYNPYGEPSNPDHARYQRPSTVMTSVGLLMQLYLGENRDSLRSQRGADHLLANLPTYAGNFTVAPVGTLENPQRDTYYWYYATQVMFHMGGKYWEAWQEHLHPLLVEEQTKEGELAGSWNPLLPVPDRWGPFGGRIYVTCLNLLSLEVSYRHLPLYEMTAE